MEVGGSCLERVASVRAYTDCASVRAAKGVGPGGPELLVCEEKERIGMGKVGRSKRNESGTKRTRAKGCFSTKECV